MLAEILDTNDHIELIENTGIQFLDFAVSIDWESDEFKHYREGYFRLNQPEPPLRYAASSDPERFVDPLSGGEVDASEVKSLRDKTVSLLQSLDLFAGVWFPVPFFNNAGIQAGPVNWVRARVVPIKDPAVPAQAQGEDTGGAVQYCIVYAVDTSTVDSPGSGSIVPTREDVESGRSFEFCRSYSGLCRFLDKDARGNSFAEQWCRAVFTDLAPERLPRVRRGDCARRIEEEQEHLLHYLNMLAFLQIRPQLKSLRLLSFSDRSLSDKRQVSLVLDIGNSRSCGLLFEEGGDNSGFQARRLQLRDFNAPEQIYQEPFPSRVEFSKADFDYNNCSALSGYIHAFEWPSLVRVGQEAAQLSALRCGNEGLTGLTSPKRFLWSTEPLHDSSEWKFNPYSYLIDSPFLRGRQARQSEHVWLDRVSSLLCSSGSTRFNQSEDDAQLKVHMQALYSRRSMMTFMLLEIFAQTLMQINSLSYRLKSDDKNSPRCLKNVILTYPPAMPLQEQEIFRRCADDALGILWKSMGYDKSGPEVHPLQSHSIYPDFPRIFLNWNEAEGAQLVYLFNESQEIFGGNGSRFLSFIRREDADGRFLDQGAADSPYICARFASIDIGGGTTDLTIRDYSFPRGKSESEANIRARELLRDGFKIAGDDILHDIINDSIVKTLEQVFRDNGVSVEKLNAVIGSTSDKQEVSVRTLKQQAVQRIYIPIGLRIMFHLEHSFAIGGGVPDKVQVSGSMADFLLGTEVNPAVDSRRDLKKPAPALHSLEEIRPILDFLNGRSGLGQYLPGQRFEDLKMQVDLSRMNQNLIAGRSFNICKQLDYLCELTALYRCDILLLTGRPSQIPGLHTFFTQRLNLSPARIISMHNYRCSGSWYPFARDDGRIGDPKTTAAVGAMLSFMCADGCRPDNFRYYASARRINTMRYLGITDNKNKMSTLLYRLSSRDAAGQLADTADTGTDGPLDFTYERCLLNDRGQIEPAERADAEFAVMLPANIGYKQFVNPRFDALPLYRLEFVGSESRAFLKNRELQQLMQFKLTPGCSDKFLALVSGLKPLRRSGSAGNAMRRQVEQLREELAAAGGQVDQAAVQRREQELLQWAQAQTTAELQSFAASLPKATGLRKLFGGGQDQARQIEAKRQELWQKYAAAGQQQLAEFKASQSASAEQAELRILRQGRRALVKLYEQYTAERLRQMRHALLAGSSPVQVRLESEVLEPVNGTSVVIFKLAEVSADLDSGAGDDLSEFVDLKLFTVSGSETDYWVDSGILKRN